MQRQVLYCAVVKTACIRERSTGPLVTCDYFPFFVTGWRCKGDQGIAMDSFPVTIQSLFEGNLLEY